MSLLLHRLRADCVYTLRFVAFVVCRVFTGEVSVVLWLLVQTGKWFTPEDHHNRQVSCLAFNAQKTFLLSTSIDGTGKVRLCVVLRCALCFFERAPCAFVLRAQLWFVPEMKKVKDFRSDTDVNAGAISPIKRHVRATLCLLWCVIRQ